MTQNDLEVQARERIAKVLPGALEEALRSYKVYVEKIHAQDDAKFKIRHDGAKAALAHIELIYKVAKRLGLPDESAASEEKQAALVMLMESARKEIGSRERSGDEE